MKSSKRKLSLIEDKEVSKILNDLETMRIEEFHLRKLLFKFIKSEEECLKRVDKYMYDRKFKRGYMKDLKSIELAKLAEEITFWKESKKEVCKDCIIIVNCSKECQKFTDSLIQNRAKEL